MTHRGPFQPQTFCASVTPHRSNRLSGSRKCKQAVTTAIIFFWKQKNAHQRNQNEDSCPEFFQSLVSKFLWAPEMPL